ncbi:zinc-dependent metalloprotease [Aquabacterium sp. UBA2148]|uniref:zinc-dependent metalloprotease n=1 Tax=Aquabacterium sp. UBA2148 TaxID=1946042 RepID=UPI00257C9CDB|nr:zinc-dependent metalloprotease [Aquabacterium sp. UBA2148]
MSHLSPDIAPLNPRRSQPWWLPCLIALLALSACATSPQPSVTATPAPAATTATPPSPSGAPASFESLTRGATRSPGLLPIWRKQDKVWVEIPAKLIGQPLFLSPKIASGIGEGGVLGGLMQSRWAQVGRPQWVTFRRVQQQVQLLAVNASYTAAAGTPQARAVEAAFSPSLIVAAPLASAADPATGALLVDASALWLNDWLGIGAHLQRQYRQGHAFDARQSQVVQARQVDGTTVFEVQQHFATASINTSPGSAAPGMPAPALPRTLPDPRSLFVQVHHSLSALPEQPMRKRPADARVGYFSTTVVDFTDDLSRTPRKQYISRWRLQKQDPTAARSKPVQPIVFWLDASIPDAYRATIRDGVLAWNLAFDAIGYKDAIEVRQATPEQSADNLATGRASIRWMTNAQAQFGAIGPTHVDPRSGEILDADIAIESLTVRGMRQLRSQFMTDDGDDTSASPASEQHHAGDACEHGLHAAEQLGTWLSLAEADRPVDPDSPEVQAFVHAYLKDVVMHEVGHALGLRHNFRASRWRSPAQLLDKALTTREGNSASVMDYAAVNLPPPGQSGGAPFQTTLGPYDFWAIEYGYGDLPESNAEAERQLRDIARRSADPQWIRALAYGSDEDEALGIDPQALTFDLGDDPVAFARNRFALAQDLIDRTERRTATPLDDVDRPRRALAHALRESARGAQVLIRQVGGVVIRRQGPEAKADAIDPLPAAQQREALALLLQSWLRPQPLRVPSALMRRLGPDTLDWSPSDFGSIGKPDVSIAEQQLQVQRSVLNQLMADGLAERLLDNRDRTQDREARPLLPAELLQRLQEGIWSPASMANPNAASWQRNLQREHTLRLAASVLRPASARADVRAAQRTAAQSLLNLLQQAPGPTAEDRAHRQGCMETLRAALSAPLVKQGL